MNRSLSRVRGFVAPVLKSRFFLYSLTLAGALVLTGDSAMAEDPPEPALDYAGLFTEMLPVWDVTSYGKTVLAHSTQLLFPMAIAATILAIGLNAIGWGKRIGRSR